MRSLHGALPGERTPLCDLKPLAKLSARADPARAQAVLSKSAAYCNMDLRLKWGACAAREFGGLESGAGAAG